MESSRQFNLSFREVLTFWELIYLDQSTGDDSTRELHPALTAFLDTIFGLKNGAQSSYHRPWVLRTVFRNKQSQESPNAKGVLQVAAFFRECADVLEEELRNNPMDKDLK
jgi:glutathione S-transferase